MSTLGQTGFLTKLLAAMRQEQTGTVTPATAAELEAVNIQAFDGDLKAIAAISGTTGFLKKTGLNSWILDTTGYLTSITSSQVTTALGYTPVTNARTLTINGVAYDLTADRSWTIAGGVTSFNTRTGAITLLSSDITSTLGYTPYNASNPAGYISSFTETDPTVGSHIKAITTTNISNWNTAYVWGNHASAGYLTGITSGQVTTALGYTPENLANKGVANGYASLDGSGLIPSTQLPSYVDDVLEYTNVAAFPGTGVTGKIYVALDTNKIYRWSGTVYIEVSPTVGTVWGGITGTLANQTDLQTALDAKVPTSRTITINGTVYDLSANRSWTINSMVYPGAGIAVSTGTAWGTSITDNSANWNTAYSWGNHAVAGYLLSFTASSTYLTISTAATTYQPLDGDLTAIAALVGTSGFLKKTAANTWSLDTNTYLTSFTETDPTVASYIKAITSTQISNWDTSYTDRLKWDGGSTGLVAATGRTSLGATTVGGNLFTLVNPTAITFIRINADNTVSTLDAATFRTAIGAGTSSTTGTVTSVSGTGTVSGLTLTGTITTTGNLTLGGTLAVTASNFSSQTANTFLAGPNGIAGVPTFRSIVAADIPTLNQNTSGSAGSVTNSLVLKADTGTTEGTDLYTFNGSAAKTLNIVAGSNITITKVAGQWTIAGSAGGTSLNGTGFVRMSGTTPSYITGTASQFVKADGSLDSTVYSTTTGTVTSVAALTLGTTGTDLSSSVATGTTTPVITLNVPTASATNRGALSSTDWITFNGKQAAITLTTTGSSGAATFSANTLNVPNYTLSGLGGQPLATNLTSLAALSYVSASFVKMTAAGTFSLDTNTYYLASNPSGYTTNTGTVTSVSITTANGVSGTVATSTTTPAITLSLGAITPSTVNGLTFTAATTGFTIAGGATTSKTLTISNTLTLAGTDTSTLNIGSGGTLGTAAFTASTAYQSSSTNLTSLAALTYASTSFVKMTAAGTFALDTNTYYLSSNPSGYITGNQSITLSGDVSGTGTTAISTTLATVTQSTGASFVKITLDTKGRVTGNTSVGSSDITSALGYTPYNSTNPSGYITSSSDISGYSARLITSDVRTISPSSHSAYRITAGFTSWANNNTSPYADYIHLRSYSDSSGGSDNLVMFLKSGLGIRIWQQTFGSATAYATYKDVAWTDGTNASGTWGISISGNAATAGGFTPSQSSGTANRIVVADANGYIINNYFNASGGGSERNASGMGYFAGHNTSDYYYRSYTAAAAAALLSGQTMNINGSSTSCTGNAATATSATSATYLNSSNYISQKGSQGSWNADFQNTPAGTVSYGGDVGANTTNNPGGTWWIQQNFRHTNGSNYWGTQIAWGWEDNANRLATRNITGGTFGGWVYYLNSSNYTSYAPSLTGSGASGTWGINVTGTAGSAPNGSNANAAYNVTPGEGNGLYFWSDSTNYTIKMGYTAGTYQYGPVTDYSMRFTMGAGTGRGFTWGYAGASPTMGLNANSGNLQIAGTFTEASSIRYKDNVADLTYSLEDVLKLRSVTYTKKGTTNVELGFIAEEVNDIIPEAVMKNEDGSVESISYGRLTAVLLNAVKEQQQQINELKNLLNNK